MKLSITGLLVIGSLLVPTLVRADCLDAIATVQQAISQKSDLPVKLQVVDVSHEYVGTPKNHPNQLVFELEKDDVERFVMAAPIRQQLAQYLIGQCPTLGSVDFVDSGPPMAAIGILPDGHVDSFKCIWPRSAEGKSLKWGESFCNPNPL